MWVVTVQTGKLCTKRLGLQLKLPIEALSMELHDSLASCSRACSRNRPRRLLSSELHDSKAGGS